MNDTLKKLTRPLELLLALVFAAGVYLKAADIELFAVQIAGYGVLPGKEMLVPAALVTLAVESMFALALLMALRLRGVTFLLLELLLLFFTALILYGWLVNDLEDCGCFGPLEMSPAVSIAKNAVLALLAAAAWRGCALQDKTESRTGFAFAKCAAAAFLTAVLVFFVNTTVTATTPAEVDRPFAQFAFQTEYGDFDLASGEHLVALLSMDCEHCRAEVPAINALLYEADLPPLVALCYEETEGLFEEFAAVTGAQFPMHSLGNASLLFFKLLGDASEPPRFAYVRDGVEIAAWNGHVPTREQIEEAFALTAQ